MKILSVKSLAIPDVKVLRFARFCDQRGFFTELFRRSDFAGHPELSLLGGAGALQINESFSRANVIRGLHFQWNPYMGKLVRACMGRMIDLVLDIRQGSPSYGRILAYDMPAGSTEDYGEWIWVPPGFAHGNIFTEPTQIVYLCSGEYSPGCEAGISPLSADLDWSLCEPGLKAIFDRVSSGPIMSDKDRNGMTLTAWGQNPRKENFVFGHC